MIETGTMKDALESVDVRNLLYSNIYSACLQFRKHRQWFITKIIKFRWLNANKVVIEFSLESKFVKYAVKLRSHGFSKSGSVGNQKSDFLQ